MRKQFEMLVNKLTKFNQQKLPPTVELYTYKLSNPISQHTSSEIKQRPDTDSIKKVTNPPPSPLCTMRVNVSS